MAGKRVTIGMKPEAEALATAVVARVPGSTEDRRNGADTVPPPANDEKRGDEQQPKRAASSADAWLRHDDKLATPAPQTSPGLRSLLPAAGVGAVAGGIVAVLLFTLVLPRVGPSLDQRFAPILDRVTAAESHQRQIDRDLGRLNNEIAVAIDADAALATGIGAQAAQLAELEQLIAKVATSDQATDEVTLPIFAVALGQLRTAFQSGRPFETELINVYALTGSKERQFLDQLSGPARTGVLGVAGLRRQLAVTASSAGLTPDDSMSYFEYGKSLINQYIGYSSEPYLVEVAGVVARDADRKLAVGDVQGAIDLVGALDPAFARVFEPWLDNAKVYVRVETALDTLTKTTVDRLRLQLGAESDG